MRLRKETTRTRLHSTRSRSFSLNNKLTLCSVFIKECHLPSRSVATSQSSPSNSPSPLIADVLKMAQLPDRAHAERESKV